MTNEELVAIAGEILDTIAREDAERSFRKTGKTVFKTTARKVQVNQILGVKPMGYLKSRGEI